MVKLVSTGHVSVGGVLYQRSRKGFVDVPAEHVAHLIASHACYLPGSEPDAEEAAEPADPAAADASADPAAAKSAE